MFWKVRAIPSAVILWGGWPVTRVPSKTTSPRVGL
jgi:hypothetical protein